MRTLGTYVARLFIRLWPLNRGIWRLIRLAPVFPADSPPVMVKLRGFPLRMFINPQTYHGRYVYYRGLYEGEVIESFRSVLRPGMTVVDVGANTGMYSVVAGFLVGEKGRVVAIEPQPGIVDLLKKNVKLNGLENVLTMEIALGEQAGSGRLWQPSSTNDGQATLRLQKDEQHCGDPVDVHIEALSTVLANADTTEVDVLKIDVEGAELTVLKGFGDFLEHRPPAYIFIECIDEHLRRFETSSEELFRFLEHYSYGVECLFHGRWHTVRSSSDHARYKRASDLVAVHRSVQER